MPGNTQVSTTHPALTKANELVKDLYATSPQAMYLFLDDANKSCNEGFAKLLGYGSPKEWAAVTTSFPQAFVHTASQSTLVHTYQEAMQDGVAATIEVTWKRKDGKTVPTRVILVPVDVGGERLALHFIEPA